MTTIARMSDPMGERMDYDARLRVDDGWVVATTPQDAPYFGMWINPLRKRIFTFAEGDVTVEKAHDGADFASAVYRALAFYDDPTWGRGMIDAAWLPATHPIRDRLVEFGLADRIH